MLFSSLGLWFVLGIGFVDASPPKQGTPTAIATVTPCPSLSAGKIPAPIRVTTQYQPVSTCIPLSKVCVKNKCWTQYSYSTHDFVSTVIPCPFASASSITTVSKTEQSVLVSRSSETVTNTYVTSSVVTRKWRRPATVASTASEYTTVVREWSAVYKDLGPYAIPDYDGSGICTKCQGPNGQNMQSLDVIECVQSADSPTVCREHPEVWIFGQAPSSARTASAICSTHTSVSAAGVYVFEFPQHLPPATIHIPPQTVTYTVPGSGGRFHTSTHTGTATTTVFPGRRWTATITRKCPRPTVINFEIIVKRVIYYVVPPFVHPHGPTSQVEPPATWSDWFPISTTAPPASVSTGWLTTWTYTSSVTTPTSTSSTSGSYTSSSYTISSRTSSAAPTTVGTGFYLQVTATPTGLGKRDIPQYLAFDANNNGIVVNDISLASLIFNGNDNSFISNDLYLGTLELADSPVQRTINFPAGFHTWYFVGNLAQLEGTAGFCLYAPNLVRAYVRPEGCANPIFLVQSIFSTSSSTTSTITSTSSNSLAARSTSASTSSSSSSSSSSISSSAGAVITSISTSLTSVSSTNTTEHSTSIPSTDISLSSMSQSSTFISIASSSSSVASSSSSSTTTTSSTVGPQTADTSSTSLDSQIASSLSSTSSTELMTAAVSTTTETTTTSITLTMSATTTSATATSSGFMLQAVARSLTKRRRDVIQVYVGFANDGAIATEDLGIASIFYLGNNGQLTTDNGKQVGSLISQDSRLIKFLNTPPAFRIWSFPSGIGQLSGAEGFCLISGSVYVVIDIENCAQPINLVQAALFPLSTSSSMAATTTTRAASTTEMTTTTSETGSTTYIYYNPLYEILDYIYCRNYYNVFNNRYYKNDTHQYQNDRYYYDLRNDQHDQRNYYHNKHNYTTSIAGAITSTTSTPSTISSASTTSSASATTTTSSTTAVITSTTSTPSTSSSTSATTTTASTSDATISTTSTTDSTASTTSITTSTTSITSTTSSTSATSTTTSTTSTTDSTTTTTSTTSTTDSTTTTTSPATTTTTTAAAAPTCAALSSPFTAANGDQFSLQCGFQVNGQSLQGSPFSSPDFVTCMEACAADPACVYANYQDRTLPANPPFQPNPVHIQDCTLLSSTNGFVAFAGYDAGTKLP
ncbi:uncharacterized protein A1O9_03829 [Exophiala aquamarina CBS 119918]|uniref:Apple domain-containing protein n=1 Tax=Exophiala aquamarina CBS 119918 TaxID=1182545 RepID=A0A072PGK0_9EURO|nr:uncharacterized protein A1O9_03829 [Exophiala aquamarina CBS 119918]KEF58986.1 hypothetical protein A1O9_03829 [Exophiala aquamarina CBS 119918]